MYKCKWADHERPRTFLFILSICHLAPDNTVINPFIPPQTEAYPLRCKAVATAGSFPPTRLGPKVGSTSCNSPPCLIEERSCHDLNRQQVIGSCMGAYMWRGSERWDAREEMLRGWSIIDNWNLGQKVQNPYFIKTTRDAHYFNQSPWCLMATIVLTQHWIISLSSCGVFLRM